jgi:hypothetical protein
MNQSFDINRWWLLVGKHWSENRKKYTLSLIAMAGLLLVWYVFVLITASYRGINTQIQTGTYYFGLFLAGCFYASILFADLGSKTRGLNYLVTPASQFEKLLCSLFYGVVVFFACYTAIFYVLDTFFVKAANSFEYNHWFKHHAAGDVFVPREVLNVFNMADRMPGEPNVFFYLLLFYFVLQAAFIYGSVYFPKFSFIKTFIALLLIGLVMAFLCDKIIFRMLPPGSFHHGIASYHLYTVKATASGGVMIYGDPVTDKLVSLPLWINDFLLFLAKFAFAPAFWAATYFRLKEKEI